MNLILLFKEDFVPGTERVCLRGRRFTHIKEILKSMNGDALTVGVLNGRIGTGTIAARTASSVTMDISLKQDPPPALPVTLALALPRPIVLNRLLSSVTSLGVKRIILFHSKQVEKTYWQSRVLEPENIRQQLILGLEQAKDTVLPEVLLRRRFKPFVEDELPALVQTHQALVAHPGVSQAGPDAARGKKPLLMILGPERGFIPYEIDKLTFAGVKSVGLGPRILRVETAVLTWLGRRL